VSHDPVAGWPCRRAVALHTPAAKDQRETNEMHELSIAMAVVDVCSRHAAGTRILRVRVEVGQLAAVLPDSLRFCFEVCAKGTVAEGAELDILEIPGRALCEVCGETCMLSTPFGRCNCGGRLRVVAGEELRVKDIDIE
jgi:hydrogenase nickel incorporation protein HypA/HybF